MCLVEILPIPFCYRSLGVQLRSVPLLRTCKTINREGCEFFYGENEWRFDQAFQFLSIKLLIPARGFQWLKSLTIAVPFPGSEMINLSNNLFLLPGQKLGQKPNQLGPIVRDFFDTLLHAPHLRQLHLIMRPRWFYAKYETPSSYRFQGLECYHLCVNSEDIWQGFEKLMRAKPRLETPYSEKLPMLAMNSPSTTGDHRSTFCSMCGSASACGMSAR